jgi:hypothetical protein
MFYSIAKFQEYMQSNYNLNLPEVGARICYLEDATEYASFDTGRTFRFSIGASVDTYSNIVYKVYCDNRCEYTLVYGRTMHDNNIHLKYFQMDNLCNVTASRALLAKFIVLVNGNLYISNFDFIGCVPVKLRVRRESSNDNIYYNIICCNCGVQIDVMGDGEFIRHDDSYYCTECAHCCNWCGDTFTTSQCVRVGSNYYCRECHDEHQSQIVSPVDTRQLIRSWNYTPNNLNFRNHVDSSLRENSDFHYFGIELEFEREQNANIPRFWQEINALHSDFWFLKQDGSLSNGCEVVSHPATMEYLDAMDWRGFFRIAHDCGLYVNSHCGMHVHTNESRFPRQAVVNVASFLWKHKRECEQIAGRTSHYAKIVSCHFGDSSYHQPDRYCAVNTFKPGTVEFRFNDGTINFDDFAKRLHFVADSVEIAYACQLQNWTPKRVLEIRQPIRVLRTGQIAWNLS